MMEDCETKGSFAPVNKKSKQLCLRMAGLVIRQEADDPAMRLIVPQAHAKFLDLQATKNGKAASEGELHLQVQNEATWEAGKWGTEICRTEIWELWINEDGRYVFVAPRGQPPRRAIVDMGFNAGEVLGDFGSMEGEAVYPLQGLDNVMLSNWLANSGDVILHASGIMFKDKGYAFIGPAGAGKSTVARSLVEQDGVTVLGEDQLVLRCIEGELWIYGTPWHLNPEMCSPMGARLSKLFFLDREMDGSVKTCKAVDGVAHILRTAFIPYYQPKGVEAIVEHLEYLAEQVPFYTLHYQLGSNVLKLITEI